MSDNDLSTVEPFDPDATLTAAIAALVARDIPAAEALSAALVEACPDSAPANYVRAAARMAQGDEGGALAAMEQGRLTHAVVLMEAESIDAARMAREGAYALAVARKFYNRFWMGPAIVAAGCAAGDPATAVDARMLLAQALQYQGRSEEAASAFGAVLRDKPHPHINSFILYSLLFVKDGMRRHAQEAHAFQARFAERFTPRAPTFVVPRTINRRLRLAYMGPTISRAQHRHFLEPLLDHHDRDRFEVIAYVVDAAKETPRSDVSIRSFGHLPYLAHAEMIRSDAIDVLVDFHGHAASGRPIVFAHKPAPVQVSWLNWTPTTGLTSMDYTLHAPSMQTEEHADQFSESIWNVGPVIAPFRPSPNATTGSPAPSLERGYVTFGAFHHPAKISDETVAAWARILRALPTARLHFKYSCYADPILQMETLARFMAHGAAPDAIEFGGHETGEAYEAAFAHIDLHLDSSPVVGGTTTMEALTRGVPFLTLRGRDFYARIGVQVAEAIGMPQLIAESWDDYVDKAVALASDLPALAALRGSTRPALDASLYRDEPAFTRMMETAFTGMFEAWLAKNVARAA